MLSFVTEFPIDHLHEPKAFVEAVRSWVLASPHTKFVAADLASIAESGEWTVRNERETLNVLYANSELEQSVAVRQAVADGDLEWVTNIIFSRSDMDTWVGVQTSCESNHPAVRLPNAKKPIIVRVLLETLGGTSDGELPVSSEPTYLSNNDIGIAGRLINGESGCRLPIVYISCDFYGGVVVNPKSLAYELSGMAHVIVEPNRAFSRRLQIEVDSENVYGGAVGIYWPEGAGRRSFFIGGEFENPASIRRSIVDEIRVALTNRRPLVRCTWPAVREAASREEFKRLRQSGDASIEEYVAVFDAEIKARSDQLADAEKEIERLKAENRRYEHFRSAGGGISIRTGTEHNLYTGEITEILRDAIQDSVDRAQDDSRKKTCFKCYSFKYACDRFGEKETRVAERAFA